MTLSKSYERAVRDYLTEGYGATLLASDPGGKHGRLRFEYNGRPYALTMARSPSHDECTAITIKKRDIRHLLGPLPDRRSQKEKRNMEDMIPDMAYHSLKAPSPAAESPSCDGNMAYYSRDRLRFYVTPAFVASTSPGPYSVARVARDMWELYPDTRAKRRFTEAGAWWCLEFNIKNLDIGLFGHTPTKYALVDGHVLAHLDVADLKPVTQRAACKRLSAPNSLLTPTLTPRISPAGIPTPEDLRAILADIRRVEATTDRRLVYLKATEDRPARWAWKADLID